MNKDTAKTIFLKAISNPRIKLDRSVLEKSFDKSQVFHFPMEEKIEYGTEMITNATINGKICLPFDSILLINNKDKLKEDVSFFILRLEDEIILLQLIYRPLMAAFCIAKEKEIIPGPHQFDGVEAYVDIFNIDKYFTRLNKRDGSSAENAAFQVLNVNLGYFLSMAINPRHFLVKVRPNVREKRSVEWTESKSHFVILSNEHGKLVNQGRQTSFRGSITRAMHSRRGHLRFLRSERFKNKKGFKIWINCMWVGPKEWQGTDKKIYKVLDKKLYNNFNQ